MHITGTTLKILQLTNANSRVTNSEKTQISIAHHKRVRLNSNNVLRLIVL